MSKLILPIFVLVTSSALIVFKLGSKAGAPVEFLDGRIHLNINPYNVTGVILYGISFLLYMYLIAKNDLGYIIPLTAAFVYLIIFLASYFIFHEIFTPAKIAGIVLILGGIISLNINK